MTANEYMKKIKDNLDSVEQNLEQIQCDDCISRQLAEACIRHSIDREDAIKKLKQLPPVTPKPKTGKWINEKWDGVVLLGVTCSCCGIVESRFTSYCPNCGCRMVDPQETETWNGYHGQITAPKGTFEKIYEDAESEDKE